MTKLADGTVLPHFLAPEHTPGYDQGQAFDNLRLRLGEVKEIVWPDDPRSRSKRLVEYRVYVEQRRNGTGAGRMYENCLLSNPFAGLADRAVWTLRAADRNRAQGGPTLGSKVLLLCVNGENTSGVIIGGLRDPQDAKDAGTRSEPDHHALAIFNGVSFSVNADGELTITYGGATAADGSTDAANTVTGSKIKLDKDGNVLVSDGSGANAVFINHKDGKVQIARDRALEIGEATDKMLLGQTFRAQQKQMHAQMIALSKSLQGLLEAAGAAITAASAVPAVIGVPPSGFAPAGAALLAAAQAHGQFGSAVQAFEQTAAQFNDYLSRFNYSD